MIKTPLILLPGLLCDEALWAHQSETLSDIADITVADMTRDERYFSLATRICAEIGAHYVKSYYFEPGFEKVVAACPVPIVIAGGGGGSDGSFFGKLFGGKKK